jgi:hypothetical protein
LGPVPIQLRTINSSHARARGFRLPGESGRVGGRRLAPRGFGRLALVSSRPHRTVHEVLPHTAHRRLSPPAFGVARHGRFGRGAMTHPSRLIRPRRVRKLGRADLQGNLVRMQCSNKPPRRQMPTVIRPPRRRGQGSLACFAEARGVLRTPWRHQHPDVRRTAWPGALWRCSWTYSHVVLE